MSEIELKTGSNVLLAVIICLVNIGLVLLAVVILLAKNLFGSACSGQYFMSEIERSACSGHLFVKHRFGSACSGQYFYN